MVTLSPAAKTYVIDLGERVISTFVFGMLAVVLAAGPASLFSASTWQAAAAGGLAALGSLVKGLAAQYRGKKSASLAKNV